MGQVDDNDLSMVNSLVLTSPDCPPTDFSMPPWNTACLVTPRHAVRTQWNDASLQKHSCQEGVQMLKLPAYDRIHGRPLLLKNWRPIALSNSNAKIFSKIISKRLGAVARYLFSLSQYGFITQRSIWDNINTVANITTEQHITNTLAFLDQ